MIKDLVSVVFPTMNRKDDLIKCIRSIKSSTHKKIEIVIADNCSSDGSPKIIKKMFPEVILLENKDNLGSPIAINNCIKASHGEFILRLDDDEIIEPDTIEIMLKSLKQDEKIGISSCLYFFTEDPEILRAAKLNLNMWTGKTTPYLQNIKYDGRFKGKIYEADAVGGGSHLVRRKLFDEIGFYSENYFLGYEDIDWCFKVKNAGYKIVVNGSAKLYHKRMGGISLKEKPFRVYLNNRGKVLFMKRNAGFKNLFFITYLFLVLIPVKSIGYLYKKNPPAIKALFQGIFDALFKSSEVFVYTKEGKKIFYH